MKWKSFFALTSTWCIFSFATVSFAEDQIQKTLPVAPSVSTGMEQNAEEGSPSAFVPANKFEFEPVIEGAEVIHDFIIQNKGTSMLNIDKVKTG